MRPLTLQTIEAAFRDAYCLEFCSEDDVPTWTPENPSRGHCALASFTLQDLLGGELLLSTVHRDGEQTGYHYWNRLGGVEIDLTREQFFEDEVVGVPEVQHRPPGQAGIYQPQYDQFRAVVMSTLGLA